MMVVHTSTSASRLANATITSSSSDSGIWPWPMMNRAFRHQFLQFLGGLLDGADAVVQEENLSVPFHLAQDGLADEVAAVL